MAVLMMPDFERYLALGEDMLYRLCRGPLPMVQLSLICLHRPSMVEWDGGGDNAACVNPKSPEIVTNSFQGATNFGC